MLTPDSEEKIGKNSPACVFLEISGQEEEKSFQIPVIVRGITGGVVTLEARDLWWPMDDEILHGRDTCLRGEVPGNHEPIAIWGTVTWATPPRLGKGKLKLGMKLAKADPTAVKVLEDLIPHAPTDLKKLWEQWDQAKKGQAAAFQTGKIHSALLGLALGIIIFKLVEPKSFTLLTDVILSVCGLVGTVEAIRILRKKTAAS